MTSTAEWLIDKSALARLANSDDADLWLTRIQRGLIRITASTILEVGFSARSSADWHSLVQGTPLVLMPIESLTPHIEQRAIDVQGTLADRGEHRAPSVPDLLIAATAELNGLTVLHQDKDFDLIADVTGQQVERLRMA